MVAHELGHAVVGLDAGMRVTSLWAPPPEPYADYTPDDPDEAAGHILHAGGDRRAKTLMTLGGLLAERGRAPDWPIRPRDNDERKLAELTRDGDELTYLECVRDAAQVIGSDEFELMHTVACELLTDPPYRLTERQLNDLMRLKKGHEDDDTDPRELELELVRRGVLDEAAGAAYAEAVTDIVGTENGGRPRHRERRPPREGAPLPHPHRGA